MAGFSLSPPRAGEFAALAQLVEALHPDTQPESWGPEHQAIAEAAAMRLLPYVRRVEARERQAVQAGRKSAPKRPVRRSDPPELVAARKVVHERSGGLCEARTEVCDHVGQHVHHKGGRKGPGAHRPERLLHVCVACHEHIHANPEQSYMMGWLYKRLGAA